MGYQNGTPYINRHVEDGEKGRYSVPTPGGVQQIVFRQQVVENGGG